MLSSLRRMPIALAVLFWVLLATPLWSLAFVKTPSVELALTFWILPLALAAAIVRRNFLALPLFAAQGAALLYLTLSGSGSTSLPTPFRAALVVVMLVVGVLVLSKDILYPFLMQHGRFWRRERRFFTNVRARIVDATGKECRAMLLDASVSGLGLVVSAEDTHLERNRAVRICLIIDQGEAHWLDAVPLWVASFGEFVALGCYVGEVRKMEAVLMLLPPSPNKPKWLGAADRLWAASSFRRSMAALWGLAIAGALGSPACGRLESTKAPEPPKSVATQAPTRSDAAFAIAGGTPVDPADPKAGIIGRLTRSGTYVDPNPEGVGLCTGTLVNECTVVTARHCLTSAAPGMFVLGNGRMAPYDATYGARFRRSVNDPNKWVDIALLRLGASLPMSQPVNLPSGTDVMLPGEKVEIFGAGPNRSGTTSNAVLRQGTTTFRQFVDIINDDFNDVRARYWQEDDTEQGVCGGDSGGPSFRSDGLLVGTHATTVYPTVSFACRKDLQLARSDVPPTNAAASGACDESTLGFRSYAHTDPDNGATTTGCLDLRNLPDTGAGTAVHWAFSDANWYNPDNNPSGCGGGGYRLATRDELLALWNDPAAIHGLRARSEATRHFHFLVPRSPNANVPASTAFSMWTGEEVTTPTPEDLCHAVTRQDDVSVAHNAEWIRQELASSFFDCSAVAANWLRVDVLTNQAGAPAIQVAAYENDLEVVSFSCPEPGYILSSSSCVRNVRDARVVLTLSQAQADAGLRFQSTGDSGVFCSAGVSCSFSIAGGQSLRAQLELEVAAPVPGATASASLAPSAPEGMVTTSNAPVSITGACQPVVPHCGSTKQEYELAMTQSGANDEAYAIVMSCASGNFKATGDAESSAGAPDGNSSANGCAVQQEQAPGAK